MAVRKVSNRGRNMIGRFPSLKLGRMVAYESLIELDLASRQEHKSTPPPFGSPSHNLL